MVAGRAPKLWPITSERCAGAVPTTPSQQHASRIRNGKRCTHAHCIMSTLWWMFGSHNIDRIRYRWEPSNVQLPATLELGKPVAVRFLVSDDLKRCEGARSPRNNMISGDCSYFQGF